MTTLNHLIINKEIVKTEIASAQQVLVHSLGNFIKLTQANPSVCTMDCHY